MKTLQSNNDVNANTYDYAELHFGFLKTLSEHYAATRRNISNNGDVKYVLAEDLGRASDENKIHKNRKKNKILTTKSSVWILGT